MHYILCILYISIHLSTCLFIYLLRGAAKSPAAETMEPAGEPPACPGGAIDGAWGWDYAYYHLVI